MRWWSLLLLILLVVILGGLAGFVANLYFSQHPILITNGQDAYNILRDIIIVVIAVLTILTAAFAAIVSWALRSMLLHDLINGDGYIWVVHAPDGGEEIRESFLRDNNYFAVKARKS